MTPPEDDRPGVVAGGSASSQRAGERTATSPSRDAAPVSPDVLLADRYRIVRLVARGGMGEVYEAEDLKLRERVALKTVRTEIAQDAGALERLMQEVHLARKVTHPNVCRIFDVFQHRAASGEGATGDVTFVTMELLPGESLADRLARAGRLSTAEALPIVRQVVSGLAGAHKAGVIHRDLKTENITLVPDPDEQGGVRAVVTDFGLARGKAAEGGDASLTELGLIVGTPAYMAPEQLEAHDVTAASDIYALGVLMYEMVTGRLPFPGGSLAAAAKRLRERPPAPRQHVPDLDSRWEAVILRCLERDAIDRFASATDVARALAGEVVTPGRRALVRQHARAMLRQRLLVTSLGVGALVLLGRGGYVLTHRPLPAPSAAAARRSVAVLGFKNLSGRPDAAWLSTALSEMLTAELGVGEKLRTIPGESVARMKVDLSLPDADTLAKDTLARIRQNLGSDLVILGSYFAAGKEGGGRVRLDVRLEDTAAGEMVAAVTDAGTEGELIDLVSRTGAQLRGKLGVAATSQAGGVRSALPTSPEAARLYAEGVGKLRLFDALAARDLLMQAEAAEPDRPAVHSALAAAWSTLGYDGKAKEEAKRAFDLSSELPREDRLSIEGRYREAAKEWDKAVEIYRTLSGFFPDNIDYGLRLAEAQSISGKGKDALATVEALRKRPPPTSEDPRIDLAEARAADSLGDFKREQAMAVRVAEKGTVLGARLLVARARLLEAWASNQLGEPQRAVTACDEAKRICAAAGDRAGVGRSLMETSRVLWRQGELARAKSMAGEAAAIAQDVGDKAVLVRAINIVGIVLINQGELAEALNRLEETLAIAREIGDKEREGVALNNIGFTLSDQGNKTGARRMHEAALAFSRENGDRRGEAFSLRNLGFVLNDQGDLASARRHFEQALAVARAIGLKQIEAEVLSGLGNILQAGGNLVQARKKHEEALAVQQKAGASVKAAESLLALAALAIEAGRPAEAEASARGALATYRKEKVPQYEALVHAALARAYLAQGRIDEASKAIEQAAALADRTEYRSTAITVAISAARVRAAAGRTAEAVKGLEAALGEAMRLGLVPLQLEARLALGEIEMKSGASAAGRARLEALEKEASAKGFSLVARKAQRARS